LKFYEQIVPLQPYICDARRDVDFELCHAGIKISTSLINQMSSRQALFFVVIMLFQVTTTPLSNLFVFPISIWLYSCEICFLDIFDSEVEERGDI